MTVATAVQGTAIVVAMDVTGGIMSSTGVAGAVRRKV